MNQTNNGATTLSQKAEAKLSEIDKLIEECFVKTVGDVSPNNEVVHYLDMGIDELKVLDPERCCEIAYQIGRQATYIQRELNKCNAKLNWAKTALNFVLAKSLNNYGGQYTPHEQRRSLAILDNSYAIKLNVLITDLQLKIDTLSFMPAQLQKQSDVLINLYRARKKYE
jgi:hypothetical protein